MRKGERVRAALAGRPVDRVPISFWRHFPDLDLEPAAPAGALLDFHRLRAICAARPDDAPILQTIFSPFSVARKLAGPELIAETMARDPQRLHAALDVIATTVGRYARACLEAGADGLFFASQAATPDVLSPEAHHTFVEHTTVASWMSSRTGRQSCFCTCTATGPTWSPLRLRIRFTRSTGTTDGPPPLWQRPPARCGRRSLGAWMNEG